MTDSGPPAEVSTENDPDRLRTLPERVDPDDIITSQATDFAKDPEMGLDPDRAFMLKWV